MPVVISPVSLLAAFVALNRTQPPALRDPGSLLNKLGAGPHLICMLDKTHTLGQWGPISAPRASQPRQLWWGMA